MPLIKNKCLFQVRSTKANVVKRFKIAITHCQNDSICLNVTISSIRHPTYALPCKCSTNCYPFLGSSCPALPDPKTNNKYAPYHSAVDFETSACSDVGGTT